MKILIKTCALISIILLAGCTGKKDIEVVHHVIDVKKPKAYQFTLKPNIGSRADDSRTVVDMGVVLKVWVKNYKNNDANLVASHDVYVWARKPDFIVGEDLPTRRVSGMPSPVQKLPFMLTGEEIDRNHIQSDEEIKKYVNKVYESENNPEISKKRKKESLKNDTEILQFLKQMRGETE
ncbi:MAG: hypothetical protein COB67_00255 [SAR324 cluster bacterium]|uniref:Lipoprotein n=1 Tax=SAR324 cluster bacterium TaxID=2024889 RepID=A0A2A4TC42_9DELT|nr:MAG: hypothetical protein COB67_00255 [SAR324 cluster bacterium]